jgi:hypothetical protein
MLISGDFNPTSRSCRSLPPTRSALTESHNVCEDLSGSLSPARVHAVSYAPVSVVIAPQTKPESSRATATTALLGPFFAASLR